MVIIVSILFLIMQVMQISNYGNVWGSQGFQLREKRLKYNIKSFKIFKKMLNLKWNYFLKDFTYF